MNQLLFDRSSGNISPPAFARIQLSAQVHAIQPASRLRFNGGEKEASQEDDTGEGVESQAEPPVDARIWAHQAGVNALAIDIGSRMYAGRPALLSSADASSLISGGADSSIKLWDLEELTAGSKHTFKPTGIVPR
jgi:DNA excision repair protein ERCC-8